MATAQYDQLRKTADKFGQGHVFDAWDELSAQERQELLADLQGVDFEYVTHIFKASEAQHAAAASLALTRVQPATGVCELAGTSDAQRASWRDDGLKMIAEGKLAVLLLAGGQGTRLGSSAPKGCYDIGLPSRKSLFQLQAERLLRLQALAAEAAYGAGAAPKHPLRWYIMTSETTDAATKAHFAQHAHFGLDPSQLFFFKQGWLPGFSRDGRVVLSTRSSLFKAPDGNGGVYTALETSGALSDMRAHAVEAVDCYCVDNAAVRLGDPVFAGYCASRRAQCGARVVAKAYPGEKVGVFARGADGVLQVVEYSEMDPEEATSVDPATGKLRFNWSNVCLHYFTVDFLAAMSQRLRSEGVYHVAHKNIPSLGGEQVPGVKLELFIFDTFPMAERAALMEVRREEEFAPVKNAPGSASDSPDTARALLLKLHASWVEAVGGKVTSGEGVEVSPLVSYAGEGLEALAEGREFAEPLAPALQGKQ